MGADYYSDRTSGPRPRTEEEVTAGAWGALVAVVFAGISSGAFAEDFPLLCDDGPAVIGTDEHTFWLAFRGELPDLGMTIEARKPPDTLAALDMVEFLHAHASRPERREFHGFFNHHHLRFDRVSGQQDFREQVNRVFGRNGLAYELAADGHIRRLGPPVVEGQVRSGLPSSGDEQLDGLLERARLKFSDPDPSVRRESLEHAWDAFDRMKTMLARDKKRGAELLIATVASDEGAELVREEMNALRVIGNTFCIRHYETDKAEVPDQLVDPLFGRMYALLHLLHTGLITAGE